MPVFPHATLAVWASPALLVGSVAPYFLVLQGSLGVGSAANASDLARSCSVYGSFPVFLTLKSRPPGKLSPAPKSVIEIKSKYSPILKDM